MDTSVLFTDFDTFINTFESYQKENFSCYRIKSSETVEKANLKTKRKAPEACKYTRCKFVCTHWGEPRYRGTGVRSHTKSSATGCKSYLHVSYDYDEEGLIIKDSCLEHNHPTTPDTYAKELRVKRADAKLKKEAQNQSLNNSTMDHGIGFLILTCGGTIDKQYPQGPGAYAFEFGNAAVEKILQRICPSFQYQVDTICAKDSQEMTDHHREAILRAILDASQQLILITHGTDTLCDTAHYLSKAGVGQGGQFGSEAAGKTVILTGAFKPEAMKDSDADFNIGFALGFASSSIPGVFVAMAGSILDGTHVMRCEDGRFVDERFVLKRF